MSASYSPPEQDVTLDRMAAAGRYNAWLLERAEPYLGPRVLDAGAGTGTFTELLAREGRDVVALEPESRFAVALRARFATHPGVTVVEGETAAGLFDAIVCFNVLEHVPDAAAALARFHDSLAPGGHLLLLVPAHPRLFGATDEAVGHVRRYTKPALRTALAGFDVRELRLVNPLGALGWLVSSRLLRRREVPSGPLALYDRIVPVLRALDRVELPFGLSVWAVARRATN